MDFELSEQQRAIREVARQFAEAEMAPHARQWDEEHIFPVDCMRRAAALGFGGIYVRENVGGAELTRLDAALVFDQALEGAFHVIDRESDAVVAEATAAGSGAELATAGQTPGENGLASEIP